MRQHYWLPSTLNLQGESANPDLPSPPDRDLQTLRRQHELILNSVGEGVYGLDLDGKVTFVNPAAAKMIGWAVEDLIGRSMHAVLHHSRPDGSPYPVHACPIYEAFRDGRVHRANTEVFWRKDGTNFPVEYISTPMQDEDGHVVGTVVAFQDITQRKWAEAVLQRTNEELELKVRERTAELCQANEQLQELSEIKSRFVAMVCHEFRNPLNNILLSASSLERYDAQLSIEQRRDYLDGVKSDVERMTHMIDDILVIGKIEARKLALHLQAINLVPFCHLLVTDIQHTAAWPHITFASRHRSLIANLDQRLLWSILTNILSNSMRYSPDRTPIALRLSQYAGQVIFRITDQGIGIPKEDLPHLFEPFHRGKNVSNIPGTGLGLNIVKRFVDLHQGQIRVDSKVGRGTTFTVTLPVHGTPVTG
ncbi:PAS domain-containing sensor histidine kinase [Leptolyngbya sp. 'hensonii']|uniref:PAS domain-containing sensor histidine kinase n=1 Tax=Leptolyngbya sp. 'hensonii' TaxID=1922337 RepID=UPI00094FB7B9|nr:PAS domain-containing sensor histidine kinase [Leptolyngbya sp. 'hensonii']OLP18137.1 PAS domain-containing sensor histidine kinase [Leptolyngbya sp. 'hensonii']